MKLSTYQAFSISILGPCFIVFLGVQSTYWFNLRPELRNIEIIISLAAIFIGVFAFKQIKLRAKTKLVLAWLAYVFALVNIIFWVSLFTACSNGDCL